MMATFEMWTVPPLLQRDQHQPNPLITPDCAVPVERPLSSVNLESLKVISDDVAGDISGDFRHELWHNIFDDIFDDVSDNTHWYSLLDRIAKLMGGVKAEQLNTGLLADPELRPGFWATERDRPYMRFIYSLMGFREWGADIDKKYHCVPTPDEFLGSDSLLLVSKNGRILRLGVGLCIGTGRTYV